MQLQEAKKKLCASGHETDFLAQGCFIVVGVNTWTKPLHFQLIVVGLFGLGFSPPLSVF